MLPVCQGRHSLALRLFLTHRDLLVCIRCQRVIPCISHPYLYWRAYSASCDPSKTQERSSKRVLRRGSAKGIKAWRITYSVERLGVIPLFDQSVTDGVCSRLVGSKVVEIETSACKCVLNVVYDRSLDWLFVVTDVWAHEFPDFILTFFFFVVFELGTVESAWVFCFIGCRKISLQIKLWIASLKPNLFGSLTLGTRFHSDFFFLLIDSSRCAATTR